VADGLWTKYVPPLVQARVVRDPGDGGDVRAFFATVELIANSEEQDPAAFYVIVSRLHQKWYAGMFERWRQQPSGLALLPGATERQGEHYEGMADPKMPRLGSGAKYHLWKPYQLWGQCMFPRRSDSVDRINKLEQYVIASNQPPANRRGKKMRTEDDPWREEQKRRVREACPPRWQRK
jgi:hypothetical protein